MPRGTVYPSELLTSSSQDPEENSDGQTADHITESRATAWTTDSRRESTRPVTLDLLKKRLALISELKEAGKTEEEIAQAVTQQSEEYHRNHGGAEVDSGREVPARSSTRIRISELLRRGRNRVEADALAASGMSYSGSRREMREGLATAAQMQEMVASATRMHMPGAVETDIGETTTPPVPQLDLSELDGRGGSDLGAQDPGAITSRATRRQRGPRRSLITGASLGPDTDPGESLDPDPAVVASTRREAIYEDPTLVTTSRVEDSTSLSSSSPAPAVVDAEDPTAYVPTPRASTPAVEIPRFREVVSLVPRNLDLGDDPENLTVRREYVEATPRADEQEQADAALAASLAAQSEVAGAAAGESTGGPSEYRLRNGTVIPVIYDNGRAFVDREGSLYPVVEEHGVVRVQANYGQAGSEDFMFYTTIDEFYNPRPSPSPAQPQGENWLESLGAALNPLNWFGR